MSNQHPFWAIAHDGARADEWIAVFGVNRVPILSPLPIPASLPGIGTAEVYLVDLDQLTPAQYDNLVQHTAAKWGYEPGFVDEELRRHGMPILARDVSITIIDPFKWLS